MSTDEPISERSEQTEQTDQPAQTEQPAQSDPTNVATPPAGMTEFLRRQPSVAIADPDGPRETLVRRDEVLVAHADLDRFSSAAGRYVDGVEPVTDTVYRARLRSSTGVTAAELSADLAGRGSNAMSVTPNHLMYACAPPEHPPVPVGGPPGGGGPHPDGEWWGGPVDRPRPIPAFSPPGLGQPTRSAPPVVAIFDTGILEHPWWADAPWFARVDSADYEELDRHPADDRRDRQAGHGTFIAGIVMQGATGAALTVRRVLRSDGLCDEAELLRALHELAELRAADAVHVLNLSFGGYTYNDEPSPHVAAAIAVLRPRTAVVAAAGNHGSDRKFWPAALPDVVAVGALIRDGTARADFSNFGSWVDTYRVGVRVHSSFVSFPEEGVGQDEPTFSGYASWSGTSFAAPAVSAEIAAVAASVAASGSGGGGEGIDVVAHWRDSGLGPADEAARVMADSAAAGQPG